MSVSVLQNTPLGIFLRGSIVRALWGYGCRRFVIVTTKRSTGVERERIDPMGFRKTCMWHISMCAKQAAKPARRLVARYYHADENAKQANGLIENTFWINPHVLRSCTQERQAVQWHV